MFQAFSSLAYLPVSSTSSSSSTCSYHAVGPLFDPYRFLPSSDLVHSSLFVCSSLLSQLICWKAFCWHAISSSSVALYFVYNWGYLWLLRNLWTRVNYVSNTWWCDKLLKYPIKWSPCYFLSFMSTFSHVLKHFESILFLSFRRVVNVIYSFSGNSPASEI